MEKEDKKGEDVKVYEIESIDSDMYDRQKRIIGWDQSKISNATILIVGVGATGNEVVKNLVLTGIGKLILIDYDFINISNLNRCVLFNSQSAQNKDYKVDVVKNACEELNPNTEIVGIKKDLKDIDKTLYKKSDVICSCLDNIEARLEANNYAYYYGVPFVDSGIEEFFGSVQSVYSGEEEAACLQCNISNADLDLMWQKFSCTGEEIESENGETIAKIATIITTTSIIGGLQSQQVLKFLLGLDYFKENGKWNPHIGKPLIGKQLNYNGLLNKFNIFEKIKSPDCWTCSYKKEE
ncbi:MAG: ThiF family adenylyltransferase [Candidatus Lokiarchaeota archaeon]|nr:ThiF family adenylyltransferase [Candidatus Lokiarchaeota archaeon]